MAFSELLSFLADFDVSRDKQSKAFKLSGKPQIRSISSFSSNSIFYFPMICSNQLSPSEQAMVSRVLERSYASFVVGSINNFPIITVHANDVNSITNYLSNFHQNGNISTSNTEKLRVLANKADNLGLFENADADPMDIYDIRREEEQTFLAILKESWDAVKKYHSTPYKILSEHACSLNEMTSKPAIDKKTKYLSEQWMLKQKEKDLWGFIGEATEEVFDDEFLDSLGINYEDDPDYKDEYDDVNDPTDDDEQDIEDEKIEGLDDSMLENQQKQPITESNTKTAINTIKHTLESVPDNSIKSCQSLSKLNRMEGKLKTLKTKYAKYLNRYKRKVKENDRLGKQGKLLIRFNGYQITNPKAFMQEFGGYCRVINRKLRLIEERKAELRKRKGLPIEPEGFNEATLTDQDFRAVDYCDYVITEALSSPDSKVFEYLDEDARDKTIKAQEEEIERQKAENERLRAQTQQQAGQIQQQQGQLSRYQQQPQTISTFGKEVFTDNDAKKANDALPTYVRASVNMIVAETGQTITRDLLVGVKTYVHKVPAMQIINDIYNCIINKRKMLRFIKYVTGEERSLADLLFGVKQLKKDAERTNGEWGASFRRRKRMAKMRVPYLFSNYTPDGTIVMTMNEVNFLKSQYGIDLMSKAHTDMIIDAEFLLGFMIVDQAEEMVYVRYHDHNFFEQYTYAQLEREQATSDRLMRELYRSFAK